MSDDEFGYEITVEVRIEIPIGWEYVGFRPAKSGEHVLYVAPGNCVASHYTSLLQSPLCCFIVRPAWQWPSWLKARWIAMDQCGDWWAYASMEPRPFGTTWHGTDGSRIDTDIFDFTPPPCTDWRESLRENPNNIGEKDE